MVIQLALTCPRCESPLRAQAFGNVTIDLCDACGGHWYDAGELERIREMAPAQRPHGPEDAAPRWVDSKAGASQCPRCRVPLNVERYAYSSDLVLDRCPSCNGMWVDAGELDTMDTLIDEWRRDVYADAQAWNDRLKAVEGAIGAKLDQAERPGRIGALVGCLLDKWRRK